MKFLIIFLVPVVFSVGITDIPTDIGSEIGSIEDYKVLNDYRITDRNRDPVECFDKAESAARTTPENSIKPITAEQVDKAEIAIKDCIENIAKNNKKVDEVKDALNEKIFETYKFIKVHGNPCFEKFSNRKKYQWNNLEDKACYESSRMSSKDCEKEWGKDGCMIDLWRKECDEEVVKGMRKLMPFMKKGHEKCVDLYSHKFDV
ncbi:unnamed protein product [Caenorhabditis angaria]|uniref:T20D4.11-like domain-containing protein n=1 Tax=Caenorhabditis angaria TaxID=860376 RepID=A0A9P1NAQ4_9PELO|nr:unnamed protein product [Caenorhabditis angaria]